MLSIRHNGFDRFAKHQPLLGSMTAAGILALATPVLSKQRLRTMGARLLSGYEVAIKLILMGSVLFGFFQLVAYLLTWSDSLLVQLPALAAWACGVIPLLYRLWWLDLSGDHATLTSTVDYSEAMLLRELLPTEHFDLDRQH